MVEWGFVVGCDVGIGAVENVNRVDSVVIELILWVLSSLLELLRKNNDQ